MKTYLFLFSILFLSFNLQAQRTAGFIPQGWSSYDPQLTLSVSVVDDSVSASFDIDCDGNNDFRIWLTKGPVPVDGSNLVVLYTLNPTFEICIDNVAIPSVALYQFGDTLCTGNRHWQIDPYYILNCYGGFSCPGPAVFSNLYIAYRNSQTLEEGWIRLSSDLYDAGSSTAPVSVTVHEVLQSCLGSVINTQTSSSPISVFPNPSNGSFSINAKLPLTNIQFFTQSGQLIFYKQSISSSTDVRNISTGIYFLKAETAGSVYYHKIVVVNQ